MSTLSFIFTMEAVIGVSLALGGVNNEGAIMQLFGLAFVLGTLVSVCVMKS